MVKIKFVTENRCFHVISHVHIIKIRYFYCPFALLLTLVFQSEKWASKKEIELLFVWVVSNKKPEDSSEGNQTTCCQLSAQLSNRHLPPFVESSHGNVMLFDEVIVPELRFVALFTKCLTFGMLLCECVWVSVHVTDDGSFDIWTDRFELMFGSQCRCLFCCCSCWCLILFCICIFLVV